VPHKIFLKQAVHRKVGVRLTAFLELALAFRTTKAANVTAFIDPELTYLLPPEYSGNLSQNFVDTKTTNESENAIFATAQKAPFISYDPEFTAILEPNPTLKLVAQREVPFADEAGLHHRNGHIYRSIMHLWN
jgi:hypothetical protein